MTPSDSAKSTPGASASSASTGQMSMFGETCERSRPAMFPTPRAIYGEHPGMSDPSHLTGRALVSSPQGIPASHSHSPGSDWARKMTATYGRRLSACLPNSGPPSSWVRTLLGTSRWGSMLCYLTWKKSVTPHGRLLFRLVPSAPHTAGIGSGFWGTPTTRDYKDTGDMTNVPENGLLGRQVLNDARMWPTPRASENELRSNGRTPSQEAGKHGLYLSSEAGQTSSMKLNSAWVSRMMGYPDDWLTLDGEVTR